MDTKFISGELFNFRNIFFLDHYLRNHKGFIAGGCFKNIFKKETVKDIDVWFRNSEDYQAAETLYKELIEQNDHLIKWYENDNTFAIKDLRANLVIELIKKTFGTPEEIIECFDFTITQFAYYSEENEEDDMEFKVLYHKDFFEHLQLNRLVLEKNELDYPASTWERSYRYQKYGYSLCRESKENLLNALRSATDEQLGSLSQSLYSGLD